MYSKKILKTALFALINAVFMLGAQAQQIPNGYEVAKWKGYRQCAVTYSFDDNFPSHFSTIAPLFENYGYRASFNVVINWVEQRGQWNSIKSVHSKGHEIASHSISHPQTASASEYISSKSTIESQLGSNTCLSFVFPNCNGTSGIDGYCLSARGCFEGKEGLNSSSTTGNDMMNVDSRICGDTGLNDANSLNSAVNDATTSNGWLILLFHGLNGEQNNYSPFSSADQLGSHLSWVKQNDSKIWAAPQSTVAKYMWERDNVNISENKISDNTYQIDITLNESKLKLNKSVYDEPLTIKRNYPSGWEGVKVFVDNTQIDAYDDGSSVVFDAAPYSVVRIENTAQAVVDNEKPTITCPADKTAEIEENENSTTIDLGTPTANDNVGIESVLNNAPNTFPVGNTTVTWTATDKSGNTATCEQTVMVTQKISDNENPTITCPTDVSAVTSEGQDNATVNLGNAITDDNIGVASVDNDAPQTYPIGTTTVTWTVTDLAGNTATCQQTVTVKDGNKIMIPLKKGWNLIGYPQKGSVEIKVALEEIWGQVEQVKDQSNFYDKNREGLGLLTEFSWAKGYFIKVSEECEFSW